MKKSLLALAVLGAFAGAASAQSSVTIYGTVDLAVAKSNGGTANNPTQGGIVTQSNSYQVIQGHANRLGFRGNEDLGGGLSAQFQIEHRFSADTGAISNASSFWQGLSYVQLSSTTAGKVYLGRNYTPAFLLAVRLDPFGWDGVGEMGSLQYGNYRTPDPAITSAATANGRSMTGSSVRESNAIGYISPSFSGFSVHAATSLSEATNNGRVMSLNGNYEAGPLFIGLNAEKVYKGNYQDQHIYQIGASYDFGVTKIMAYGAQTNYGARVLGNGQTVFTGGTIPNSNGQVLNTINGANRVKAKVYEIAAVTPIGGGALKTGFIQVSPDGPNNKIQKLGVGYDYFLSKRTKVYVDGAYAKEETLSKSKLVAVGMRHDF
jgi:predicted porin